MLGLVGFTLIYFVVHCVTIESDSNHSGPVLPPLCVNVLIILL
jgi:hypothetical protein